MNQSRAFYAEKAWFTIGDGKPRPIHGTISLEQAIEDQRKEIDKSFGVEPQFLTGSIEMTMTPTNPKKFERQMNFLFSGLPTRKRKDTMSLKQFKKYLKRKKNGYV